MMALIVHGWAGKTTKNPRTVCFCQSRGRFHTSLHAGQPPNAGRLGGSPQTQVNLGASPQTPGIFQAIRNGRWSLRVSYGLRHPRRNRTERQDMSLAERFQAVLTLSGQKARVFVRVARRISQRFRRVDHDSRFARRAFAQKSGKRDSKREFWALIHVILLPCGKLLRNVGPQNPLKTRALWRFSKKCHISKKRGCGGEPQSVEPPSPTGRKHSRPAKRASKATQRTQ